MKDFLKALVYGGVFAIPFITLIVANDMFFPFITGKNFTFRILVTVMVAAWALLALLDPYYRPRWSWVIGGFGALIGVMFVANLLGAHPPTSFWSNYERMEGYVTLVHLFLYVLVAGSVLRTQQQWTWFWYTSLAVAAAVALHGLGQSLGWFEGGGGRVQGRLGNAAYMAIYMLFHIFLAMYMFVRSQELWPRVVAAVLILLFVVVLLLTGTRGTAIGLVVGSGVTTIYIAIFARRYPQFRNYAIGAVAVFILLLGGFFAAKDTSVIQDSRLSRIANIDLQQDLAVRQTIWGIAWQGVQDRPVLGWGQSNFNFVFNQYYDPFLYDQEQWFDRVHNIFLDWLIAGGVLGLLAYLLLFFSAVYYLVRYTAKDETERGFSVLEQGVLLGLLAGYLTHNLVVFDNIVSYLFFASVLAMIHSRIATEIPSVMAVRIPSAIVTQTIAPAVLVLTLATVYYVNIPALQAAGDILHALRATSIEEQREWFATAFDRRSTMGKQEIAEQMAQQAMRIASQSSIPEDVRTDYIAQAENMLLQVVDHKPGDARVHIFIGSFYRNLGDAEEGARQFAISRELSPKKQSIILQQGITAIRRNDLAGARDFFAEAFYLDERNDQARLFYAASLFQTGASEEGLAVAREGGEAFLAQFAQDDFAIQSVNQAEEYIFLGELYEQRVAANPTDPQAWATWAFAYYQAGELDTAVAILNDAAELVPTFAPTARCFIGNIQAGREPQDGC